MNHLNEERIQNYLDGSLNAAEQAAIRQHIDACDECRHTVNAFQEVYTLLEADAHFDLPKNFTHQVLKKTHKAAIGSLQFGLLQLFSALAAVIVLINVVLYYVQIDEFIDTAKMTSASFQQIFTVFISAFQGIFDKIQFDGLYIVIAVGGLIALFIVDRLILQPRFRTSL